MAGSFQMGRAVLPLSLGAIIGIACGVYIGAGLPGIPSSDIESTTSEGAVTSAQTSSAPLVSSAPAVPCEQQTWPYLDEACAKARREASKTARQIRLISTDRNAPATIVAPKASPVDSTAQASARQPESVSRAADPASDQPPQTAAAEAASTAVAEPASAPAAPAESKLSDRQLQTVRTITVRSGSAASRTDNVMVRVYHLPNGRRITSYSNTPQADAGSRPGERVFVVPAENPAEAYAYAPR